MSAGPLLVSLNPTVTLTDRTVTKTVVTPSTATAIFTLQAGSDVIANVTDVEDWISPRSVAGSAYEVQSTVTAGTFTTDPSVGAWIGLGSDRTWNKTQAGIGVGTVTATFKIRNASSQAVLATKTITLTAEVTA